jgi:multicomponent Na+:H+ antiporter subunit A
LTALLLLHAAMAGLAPLAYRRIGRRVFWLCAAAPAAAISWAASRAATITNGRPVTESVAWVPQLSLELTFQLDAFGLLMIALVSGIGVIVFWYAGSYFAGHETPKLGAFAAQLTLFAGAMLGLVTADNLFALFVFWEITAVTSYLLIGYDDEKGSARAAARQAIITTSAGGLALLAGFVLLRQAAGTASLHEILSDPPSGGVVPAALLLVIVGAGTKSAQTPFHSWLPAAMTAPTPVSAYLHSATMVKAGVYLIARFAPAFAQTTLWRPVVITLGFSSMFVGGYRALRQHDLKLLLAYGTVSQLGLLFVLFGTGTPGAIKAGAAMLLAHALFKAPLFLTVGIIDHQAHTRDVRRLDQLARRMPWLAAGALTAAASMAAIPLLFGFAAKELAYEAYLHHGIGGFADAIVLAGLVAGSALTVAYSGRFAWGAFARKRVDPGASLIGPDVPHPTRTFVAPVLVLAAASVVFGAAPSLANTLVIDAAHALDAAAPAKSLAVWHGFNVALGLSALTLLAGTVMITQRERIERWQAVAPSPAGPDAGYSRLVELVNVAADRVTGVVQNGSLPTYVSVVALTVLALPGVALAAGAAWPRGLAFADSWLQVLVVVIVIAAALGTTITHRRFAAVLLVGTVGFAVAALFVIHGGADLALTQLLVETLAVLVFVLVLRHLPERFAVARRRPANVLRAVVAGGIGLFVTMFTIVAGGVRQQPSVAAGLIERSVPEGGGRNVVNVILTDFRALDTLGEITVLAVAALGIVTLVSARRRDQDVTERVASDEGPSEDVHTP